MAAPRYARLIVWYGYERFEMGDPFGNRVEFIRRFG